MYRLDSLGSVADSSFVDRYSRSVLKLLAELLDIVMRSLAAAAHKEFLEGAVFAGFIDHLGQLDFPGAL